MKVIHYTLRFTRGNKYNRNIMIEVLWATFVILDWYHLITEFHDKCLTVIAQNCNFSLTYASVL